MYLTKKKAIQLATQKVQAKHAEKKTTELHHKLNCTIRLKETTKTLHAWLDLRDENTLKFWDQQVMGMGGIKYPFRNGVKTTTYRIPHRVFYAMQKLSSCIRANNTSDNDLAKVSDILAGTSTNCQASHSWGDRFSFFRAQATKTFYKQAVATLNFPLQLQM